TRLRAWTTPARAAGIASAHYIRCPAADPTRQRVRSVPRMRLRRRSRTASIHLERHVADAAGVEQLDPAGRIVIGDEKALAAGIGVAVGADVDAAIATLGGQRERVRARRQ